MTILTKCHRHYLFVEGKIGTGIGNRILEECTIHDNYFRPPAGRALTFLRQEKQAKVPALLPAFREVRHVPPLKPFLFPRTSGKKVFSRCGTHLPSSAAKGECTPVEKETF